MRVPLFGAVLFCAASFVACEPSDSSDNGFAFTDQELDTHDRVDSYRDDQGLPALEPDLFLGELARTHSENMLSGEVPFSHDGFEERAQAMLDDGASAAAENVAFNEGFADPVLTSVEGWIGSPGHQENMVGDFTHGGIGIATDGTTYYFTHLFAKR